MIARHKLPSRSQWAILAALAETGALKRKGARFFANERAPRSFAFGHVIALIPRGYARASDGNLSAVKPTALCRAVLAARAAQSQPAPAPGPAMPQTEGARL
jgi:hypothetical protein